MKKKLIIAILVIIGLVLLVMYNQYSANVDDYLKGL